MSLGGPLLLLGILHFSHCLPSPYWQHSCTRLYSSDQPYILPQFPYWPSDKGLGTLSKPFSRPGTMWLRIKLRTTQPRLYLYTHAYEVHSKCTWLYFVPLKAIPPGLNPLSGRWRHPTCACIQNYDVCRPRQFLTVISWVQSGACLLGFWFFCFHTWRLNTSHKEHKPMSYHQRWSSLGNLGHVLHSSACPSNLLAELLPLLCQYFGDKFCQNSLHVQILYWNGSNNPDLIPTL